MTKFLGDVFTWVNSNFIRARQVIVFGFRFPVNLPGIRQRLSPSKHLSQIFSTGASGKNPMKNSRQSTECKTDCWRGNSQGKAVVTWLSAGSSFSCPAVPGYICRQSGKIRL